MTPDAVPADGIKSALVLTTMPLELPAMAPPIMKPVTVTVTLVFAAIDRVSIETQIEVCN